MKNRTHALLILIATLFIIGMTNFIALGAEVVTDPLWQKAVETATANRNLIPGNMMVTTEDLDDKGKVKTSEQTWLHSLLGPDNLIQTEILKAISNGKDVTAERQQQAKKAAQNQKAGQSASHKGEGVNLSVEIPFYADSQNLVKYKPLNRAESVQGKNCVLYEYTYAKDEKNTYQGTAWLDTETGIPAQIQYSPNPLPKYVSRMNTTVVFTYQPDNQLFSSQIKVEGAGGFLLFKKNIRMTMKCSDYWKYAGKLQE